MKLFSALPDFERRTADREGRIDPGTIALGWRERHASMARWYEQFAARESMTKTRPPAA